MKEADLPSRFANIPSEDQEFEAICSPQVGIRFHLYVERIRIFLIDGIRMALFNGIIHLGPKTGLAPVHLTNIHRRYMPEIFPIRRKTLSNQSINYNVSFVFFSRTYLHAQ